MEDYLEDDFGYDIEDIFQQGDYAQPYETAVPKLDEDEVSPTPSIVDQKMFEEIEKMESSLSDLEKQQPLFTYEDFEEPSDILSDLPEDFGEQVPPEQEKQKPGPSFKLPSYSEEELGDLAAVGAFPPVYEQGPYLRRRRYRRTKSMKNIWFTHFY